MLKILACTIITISCTAITEEKKSDDDITTMAEFQDYMKRSHSTCSGNDVSTCPDPDRSVCLDNFCYKTCQNSGNCAQPFLCSKEKLCKPRGCIPCIKGPTYPTTVPPLDIDNQDEKNQDEFVLDASSITTVDEWEEYLRNTDSFCPSGDVSECPRQRKRICLDGKCFKKCDDDNDCADAFTCNFEGLCKPANCTPCIRKTMYPTSAIAPAPFTVEEDITTEDEFDAYMRKSGNMCPSGDVSECKRQKDRICLAGKCFKQCIDDGDCSDKFMCNFEGLCKPKKCTPCQRATYYPTPQPPLFEEDITTEDEFDEYMRKAGNMCPSGDVSECKRQKDRICLAGKCFKQCVDDGDCSDKFMCNFEGLCKPKKCTPCQRATYYPTPQPPSYDEDITTEDEFDEYMRKSGNMCPNGDVSECKRQKDRICLQGKCFKQCLEDTDCSDKFMCNFEGLCKPKKCTPCQRATYYPTPQPPAYDEDITTQDEFDEYMRKSGNMCPSGDVSECKRQKDRICLQGKCFKQCGDDNDCSDKFMCNFEGLCKPKKCTPCQRATYYPTPQPPSEYDEIMAVIDGVKFEEEEQHQIFSTSMMIKMTSLVGVIIMIFWICGGCMLWNNGDNKKIVSEPSTKYGATGTSSV